MQLPEAFIATVKRQFGDYASQILMGYNQSAATTIRINPLKLHKPDLPTIPWCDDGFILPERPIFTGDPLLHAGAYYVQEASSMIIGNVLSWVCQQITVQKALDCCASPGGKSSHLRSILPTNAILLSNEFEGKRIPQLIENLVKWGGPPPLITNTTVHDIATTLSETFDFILIDAPCSGEGLFRKQPDYIQSWNAQLSAKCAMLQQDIVQEAWMALKPGGYLLYSTCTLNDLENGEIIKQLKSTYGGESTEYAPLEAWGLLADNHGGWYSLPGFTCGEPFYFALLRKPGVHHTENQSITTVLVEYQHKNTRFMVHPVSLELLEMLNPNSTRLVGYALQHEDYPDVPSHALSIQQNWACTYPNIELTHQQAIQYLQRNALHIEAPKGLVRFTFFGLPLGLGKSVGNRINNLYPKNWRILSQRINTNFSLSQYA